MLGSGRSQSISDGEKLARFAISKSQFSRVTKKPKPNLLSPNPHIELSVLRIDDLDESTIKSLGDDVATKRGKEKSLGYAKLKAAQIKANGLTTIADEPPEHHANIAGWSNSDDKAERRRLQLVKAKQLVEESNMVFFEV